MSKRILIDIGHPAHVHYFKNIIKKLSERGHSFKIVARDKEVAHELLNKYSIEFSNRGSGSNNPVGKFIYLIKGSYLLNQIAKSFNPDIYLSFASPYAAISSYVNGKPHIVIDDTDHAILSHKLYAPFSDVFINPSGFKVKFKKGSQIFVKSFFELTYLHPEYFTPNSELLEKYGIDVNNKYAVIRFVSWNANHDINAKGLSLKDRIKLIDEISKFCAIHISSEGKLPASLQKYELKIPPDRIHDVLAGASLFIGESGTMSSECAVLGVPNIQIRHTLDKSKVPGVHLNLEKRGLKILKDFKDISGVIEKAFDILNNLETVTADYRNKKETLINESDDINEILCDIIGNYPDSLSKY